ncbi:hypothetical protein ROHU_018990 [Labeo rohita]|uniref:Uncharacterized protein n=1 Tax=Labeo rohita TaxID=84645 RepID=A0A498NAF6_LABRO|nr:hypothetical protein ROHU_018990 [Labeo rohita]
MAELCCHKLCEHSEDWMEGSLQYLATCDQLWHHVSPPKPSVLTAKCLICEDRLYKKGVCWDSGQALCNGPI